MEIARRIARPRLRCFCSAAQTVAIDRLEGKCECGKCGFVGLGASALNFYSHSSAPRAASGAAFLAAAGFRHDQVRWFGGDDLETAPPEGSSNAHFQCKSCATYLGVDAERLLGLVALNLDAVPRGVSAEYRPNHHLFYDDRVVEVEDALPKWSTIIQGDIADAMPAEGRASVPPPRLDGDGSRAADGGTLWDASTGRVSKDVLLFAPFKSAEPLEYHFTEVDPVAGHRTVVRSEQIAERVLRKYDQSPLPPPAAAASVGASTRECDVVIVGGGHNGLTTAAYLARAGLDVVVLERRHCLGGAAVTEEIVPGFKFSRASYLAGLMRPQVIAELGLEAHGFEYIPRDVSSFTPTLVDGPHEGKHLFMGIDEDMTRRSISQWSERDADALAEYETFLDGVRDVIQPLLDGAPPMNPFGAKNRREGVRAMSQLVQLGRAANGNREVLVPLYELISGPASHILDRYFDGEVLKTTLACDAVIGAMVSPRQAGSAYVLLHHVMGEAAGRKGSWAYMRGGMGTISEAIAAVARDAGAELVTHADIRKILHSERGAAPGATTRALGVELADGTRVMASKAVVSGISPYQTFMELLPGFESSQGFEKRSAGPADPGLPRDFAHHIRHQDFSCGAFKINLAVDALPNFQCCPNSADGAPGPQHNGTIHFEERMDDLENAYREASMGVPATRPVIEMTIPRCACARTSARFLFFLFFLSF